MTKLGVRRAAFCGALMMTTALAGVAASQPAYAQTAASAQRRFDIPAQPLREALLTFGAQSGIQVTAEGPLVEGRTSTGISGNLAPAEALSRLLTGTGLTFRYDGIDAVRIERASKASVDAIQLGPVRVEGATDNSGAAASPSVAMIGTLPPPRAGGQVARGGRIGLLGNRDAMDVPFSITSYTSLYVQDVQARTLADVFATNPSIRASTPNFDNFNIRGFGVNRFGNTSFDGLYGVAPTFGIRVQGLERVEVLKGPAAFLNGLAPFGTGLGGAINLVPKRAADEPLTRVALTYESESDIGAHLDVGRRFGAEKQFGLRFNLSGDVGDRELEGDKHKELAGTVALDYRGTDVRLTLDFGRIHEPTSRTANTFSVAGTVAPLLSVPSKRIIFHQPYEYQRRDSTYGMARAEWDLADNLVLGLAAGASRDIETVLRTNPQITTLQGDVNVATLGQVYRDDSLSASAEASARYNVNFWGASHTLSLATNVVRSKTRFDAVFEVPTGFTFNIYNPDSYPTLADPGIAPGSLEDVPFDKRWGVAISDLISIFDDRLSVMLGLRYQNIRSSGGTYTKAAVTPAFGVVLKPSSHFSLYANYLEALSPGSRVGPGFNNTGEVFPPFRGKQYELGAKVELGGLLITTGLFQIAQPSLITDGGTTPLPTRVLAGEQRNRGAELEVSGEVIPGIRLLGGVSYTEAILTKTQGGINDGKTAPNIPRWLFNIGTEWDVSAVPGLTFTGLLTRNTSAYLNAANTQRIPSWTQVDLGLRYTTAVISGNPTTFRATVENVADDLSWRTGGAGSGALQFSPPRTFRFSITTDF